MRHEVTAVLEAYREALRQGPRAIAELYAAPCVVLTPAAVHVHATRHEVERYFGEVAADDRAKGVTHGEIRNLDVHPLGSTAALATVRWAYMGACEELLGTATISYHLDRRDGAWKILVHTMHDA